MADVVGFSRMMRRDEDGTTDRILGFHEGVRLDVERHGGRVVSTAGDSVFGEFESIIAALECAAAIQRGLGAENEGKADGERVDVRIGLHLGDVIVEDHSVFGDGVNVAARLEQIADPGGIMLSEAVYQVVRGRTDLPMEALGAKKLKNIDEPMRVYRIGPDALGGAASSTGAASSRHRDRGRTIRDAVDAAVERASDESEGQFGSVVDADDRTPSTVAALFDPGTLSLLVMGVLGILGRTSGWTDNSVYPFLGAWFVGMALGRSGRRLSRRRGVGSLFAVIGLGVGTAFLGSVVLRAVVWVMAAAMLGGAIRSMGKAE